MGIAINSQLINSEFSVASTLQILANKVFTLLLFSYFTL